MTKIFSPGLSDIIAIQTKLSEVTGNPPSISLRGVNLSSLVGHISFEETVSHLWFGSTIETFGKERIQRKLLQYSQLPQYIKEIICNIPININYMTVLQ
ncbi:hypothetical protein WAC87_001208 [Shigella flexneri]